MNRKTIETDAKYWLMEKILKEKNYHNFEIIETTNVDFGAKTNAVLFTFKCKYTWTLNAWQKNVDTEIYVLYDKETKQFLSPIF